MTANITLAGNNEIGNDLFRRHAVYDLRFLWKQISNYYFWIPCHKHRRHSPDLISLLSHTVHSTTAVLPWEELFYSLVTGSYVLNYQPLCHSCIHLVTIFRCVRKTAKTDYHLRHVCLSVMEQLGSQWRILMKFEYFSKICREYSSFH